MTKLILNELNNELDKEIGVEKLYNPEHESFNHKDTIRVLGLAVEKYLTDGPYSDYVDRETIENERYKLVVQDLKTKDKYVILLSSSYGACETLYTVASYGHMKIEKLEKDFPLTHIPNHPLIIKGFSIDPDDLSWHQSEYEYDENDDYRDEYHDGDYAINNVFSYSNVGNDEYYPTGSVAINKKLFIPLARAMEKRPVWIIEGASGTGKSTLASHLEGLTVFETDSVDKLPESIKEDVIVLGNRSGFKREDVTKRIFGQPNVNLISITFNKEDLSRDYLQEKSNKIKKALKIRSAKREMGKTANPRTNKVEKVHKRIAEIQSDTAKKIMRQNKIISAFVKSSER